MPDFYGNPIPGVDTVYDYFGNIVAPTAAQAQAINAAYNQSQVSGTPMPSQQEIGSVITPDVSAADYAAYVNASYQQAQITQPQGTGATQLSNGIYVDAQGNQIGTGPTYITTLQGIATIPEANSITEQIAQNIALFGTAQPGIQTVQKPETLGTNPSYLAAAGAFLSQQGAKKAAAGTTTQSQSQGRAAQEAYIARQYLNRPDIYPVTDPKQKALIESGYTQLGAAEELYSQSKTQSERRYYETLMTQAITSRTGESAAYHTWAANTGVAQKANPYEYTADLMVYLQQGYPTKEKNVFSPVDYTVLGLKEGKGINDYIWGSKKYDIGNAVGIISAAEKSGEMGPYGKLSAFSSGYGVLPLELQQQIGAVASTSPENNDGWKVDLSTMWGAGLQTEKSTGTKVVTPHGVALGTGPEVMFTGLPKPFVSGKLIEPTGKVGIPFTDVAFTTPFVSDVLKYFESPTFVSGRASEVKEVPYSAMAGPDYTRQYISSVTGKPVKEFTVGVGAPVVTERIIPETGETEITTTQKYITFPELPQSAKTYGFAAVEQKSEYEKVMDKEFRSRILKPEEGEALLAVSQLVNPLSRENALSLAGKAIGYTTMERLGFDTAQAKGTEEMISSLTSPTKGQYTFFYEHPETAVVSYAAGGLFGAGTRGLGAIASKSGKLSAIAPYVSKYGGAALGGLYVGGATYEETGGFRTFTPETVAATKARLTQEGIPMTIGFGAGYRAPDVALSAIEPTTTRIKMEYPQFVEESGRVAGTARYIGYKAEPLTKPIVSAISSVKADVAESVKSPEYGKFLLERGYQKYVEIPAKSFLQELVPTMAGEIPGKTVPIKSLGKTTGSAQPKGGSTVSGGGGMPPSGSRMTMRMVGGKMTSALAREPSLKLQGVSEKIIPKEKTTIGTRTDYRGKPASQRMKQMYEIKQSASQSKVLLTERLPTKRYIERQQIPQQQMQEQVLIQRQVEPKYAFEQVQEIGLGLALAPRFVESRQEMEPVVSSISKQQQESKLTRQFQSIQQSKQKLDSEIAQRQSLKQTELQAQATLQSSPMALMVPRVDTAARGQARSIETTRARATESAKTTPVSRDSSIGRITDQPLTRTTTTPRPTPITTIIPSPPFIPSLPTSSGGRGTTGQRFRSFRETLRIGEGVRWIDINGRKQAPYRAPVTRSEPAKGKTSTASKRKRGLRF